MRKIWHWLTYDITNVQASAILITGALFAYVFLAGEF